MNSICVPRSTESVTLTEKRATACSATYGHPKPSVRTENGSNLSTSRLQKKPNLPISSIEALCARLTAVYAPDRSMIEAVWFSLFTATLTCKGSDVTCANVFTVHPADSSSAREETR